VFQSHKKSSGFLPPDEYEAAEHTILSDAAPAKNRPEATWTL
jgi:hypothetical protein